MICGTSIGSLVGWFVATGQYTKLQQLWSGIASERIFTLKRKYAATAEPSSGVLTRVAEVVRLAGGLVTTERGILDGATVEAWIERHVDPRVPVLVPFVFTATNLGRQRGEYFYRLPFLPNAAERDAAVERLRATIGPNVVVRPATDELLRPAIRASAALPVLFDPVTLPEAEGSPQAYLDGGIADNTPIDAARALAREVYAVLVDPANEPPIAPKNAVEVGVAAFGIAQKRLIDASLRGAYRETRGKRIFAATGASPAERAFLAGIYDVDLSVLRPDHVLAAQVADFDKQQLIDQAVAAGRSDALAGWKTYTPN